MPGDLLTHDYLDAYPSCRIDAGSRLTLLHMSDTHIGCKQSIERIVRVKELLKDYMNRNQGDSSVVVPVERGHHAETGREQRDLRERLPRLPEGPAAFRAGSDLRPRESRCAKEGGITESIRLLVPVPEFNTRIEWIPDHPVGILCWNSSDGGTMARGGSTGKQYRAIEERLNPFAGGKTNPVLIFPAAPHIPCSSAGSIPRCADSTGRPLGHPCASTSDSPTSTWTVGRMHRNLSASATPTASSDLHGPQSTYPSRENTRPSAGKPPILVFGCGSSVAKNTYLYRIRSMWTMKSHGTRSSSTSGRHLMSGRLMAETHYDKGRATDVRPSRIRFPVRHRNMKGPLGPPFLRSILAGLVIERASPSPPYPFMARIFSRR